MIKRLSPVVILLAIMWLVFGVNFLLFNGSLNHWGLQPRTLSGLWHIPCVPFLHANLQHIVSNSIPFLILGGIISLQSPSRFAMVTIMGTILGGLITWLIGRNACHIGASGLIFCYFGFILASAIYKRTMGSIVLAVLTFIAYGGILWGLMPQALVSWEGHAAGLISGVFIAWSEVKVSKA